MTANQDHGLRLSTERGVDFSLAIFILLILFFLSRYPVPLTGIFAVHAGGLFHLPFFSADTLGLVLHSIFGLHAQE